MFTFTPITFGMSKPGDLIAYGGHAYKVAGRDDYGRIIGVHVTDQPTPSEVKAGAAAWPHVQAAPINIPRGAFVLRLDMPAPHPPKTYRDAWSGNPDTNKYWSKAS